MVSKLEYQSSSTALSVSPISEFFCCWCFLDALGEVSVESFMPTHNSSTLFRFLLSTKSSAMCNYCAEALLPSNSFPFVRFLKARGARNARQNEELLNAANLTSKERVSNSSSIR